MSFYMHVHVHDGIPLVDGEIGGEDVVHHHETNLQRKAGVTRHAYTRCNNLRHKALTPALS